MAYVTPTVRSVGDAVTAADYNIMANDVIQLATPAYGTLTSSSQVLLTTSYASLASVTITASGFRPVLVTWSVQFQEGSSGGTRTVSFQTYAGGVAVGVPTGNITAFYASHFGQASGQYIELPSAGSRTYAVYGKADQNSSVYYQYRQIVVTEI